MLTGIMVIVAMGLVLAVLLPARVVPFALELFGSAVNFEQDAFTRC